jgi:hypothetical protein
VGSSARSLPDCLTALLPSCPTTVDHKTPTHCVSNDLNTTQVGSVSPRVLNESICLTSPMAQDNGQDPGVASRGLFPGESSPLARGPSPRRHRRKTHATTGRYTPPAHPHRGPTAYGHPPSQRSRCAHPPLSSGGTSEDLQQIPCHSIPHLPPRGRPALSILHSVASHPPKGLLSPVAGCVYAVGQGVDSGRHARFRAMP